MTKRFQALLAVAFALTLIGAGCQKTTTNSNTNTTSSVNSATVAKTLSYSGQDGKNALELLQASHQVEEKDGFVNSIDGTSPVGKQYWAFYVNGKLAEVGGKDYQTHNADTIEWKLVAY